MAVLSQREERDRGSHLCHFGILTCLKLLVLVFIGSKVDPEADPA